VGPLELVAFVQQRLQRCHVIGMLKLLPYLLQKILLLLHQLFDFGTKFLTGVRLAERHVQIHEFFLEEERVSGICLVEKGCDQTKGGIPRSFKPPSAGAAVNHWFPVDFFQFPFSSISSFFVYIVPHSRDEDNVLECILPTKLLENAKVRERSPSHAIV